jgi:hypothetical protein
MKGHAMPGTCTALAINRMSTRIDDFDAKVEDDVDNAGSALHGSGARSKQPTAG